MSQTIQPALRCSCGKCPACTALIRASLLRDAMPPAQRFGVGPARTRPPGEPMPQATP